MTVFMAPLRGGVISPHDFELVSPELVLVDPVLAASARAALPEPVGSTQVERLATRRQPTESDALIALANAALDQASDEPIRAVPRVSRRLGVLAGMAVGIAAVLLFLDVRVQVGETPASAEGLAVKESPPSQPVLTPSASNAKSRTTGNGERTDRSQVPKSRRFAWAPVPDASGYHVEFFRGPQQVFSADTKRPEVTVPARWNIGGRRQSILPGEYRWYVWPLVAGRRGSQAVVRAKLVIPVG